MQMDDIGEIRETESIYEVNILIQQGWILLRIASLLDRNIYILGERWDKKDEKL